MGYPVNSMGHKNYYDILGVGKDATQQAIKDAYRKLAFQYHPDKNKGDPAATDKMKDLNEAYAVLSDPAKRKEYDFLSSQYGTAAYDRFRQAHTTEDIFRGSDIDQVFEEFARMFGFRSSGDIFRESYGPQYQTFRFYRTGGYGQGYGNRHGFQGQNGARYSAGTGAGMPVLNGVTGKIIRFFLKRVAGVELPERGDDLLDNLDLEPEMASRGGEVRYSMGQKNLMVTIPAGIKDGQRIRLRGMGAQGKAGGEPGDLYLEVKTKKSFFQKIKNMFTA